MSLPRILLISATTPGEESTGGVYLRTICDAYPKGLISAFTVTATQRFKVPKGMEWLPMAFAPKPTLLPSPAHPHKAIRLAQLRAWSATIRTVILGLVQEISRFAKRQGTDLVWVVLNDPLLFKIAWRVARAINVELVSMVWDPPEYLIRNLNLRPWMDRSLQREFDHTLRMSRLCGAISENMACEYKNKYGIPALTMMHSIDVRHSYRPCSKLRGPNRLIIGFAGSLYARQEWEALLGALSDANWIVAGRNVSIQFMGGGDPSSVTTGMPVQRLGWRSQSEAIRLLSEVDVAYLPYWFDKRFAIATRLSFPSKLTAYAAAGKPVLFHGPVDSSVTGFFEQYPMGVVCHSLLAQNILQSLAIFTNPKFYATAAQATDRAFSEVFDWRVSRLRVARFFGVSPECLTS